MRAIPAALKDKLLERFKADATASAPHLRLVATQTSVNTLLSEPIHEDIAPAFGDVAVRQMEGDAELALAYAVCLDDGVATLYRRQFPAGMDLPWEYLWTYGPAEDVALEFDGTWLMDSSHRWYYLQTEEFPYLFTVEAGTLYVQKWNDASTRTELAAGGVSQISACKGWRNSIDQELDQGLIIGYLRGGQVFYRALCTQSDGTRVWETEYNVEELGGDNVTLSVFRANDFRVGFLTEQAGQVRLALSHRNYAGMSVRPEALHIHAKSARFYYLTKTDHLTYTTERASVNTAMPYFNFDTAPGSPEVAVLSYGRLNREEAFDSYGVKLYLDKPLSGYVSARMVADCQITYNDGAKDYTVRAAGIQYHPTERSLTVLFPQDIRRTYALTVTVPESRYLWYMRVQDAQRWYLPALTVVLDPETRVWQTYADETLDVTPKAELWRSEPDFHDGFDAPQLTVAIQSAAIELLPAQSLPI